MEGGIVYEDDALIFCSHDIKKRLRNVTQLVKLLYGLAMKPVHKTKGFDMGDRALVILKSGTEYSPVMYLHWHAPQVQNYINRLKEVMKGREGDIQYSFARLVGIAHNDIQGNLSLGCWSLPDDFSETDKPMLEKMSHGDGGIYVVDLKDFTITTYAGYGLEHQNERDGGEADRIAVRAIADTSKKAA